MEFDDYRDTMVRADQEPKDEGCTCQNCGNKFRVDFMVPDALWAKIATTLKNVSGGGLLCGNCIVDHIEALGKFGAFLVSPELTKASQDVLAERQRQRNIEGWTEDHDDEHMGGELAVAASCYAYNPSGAITPLNWPWHPDWWKPGDARRNLVKAAALALAEIERLDRKAARES